MNILRTIPQNLLNKWNHTDEAALALSEKFELPISIIKCQETGNTVKGIIIDDTKIITLKGERLINNKYFLEKYNIKNPEILEVDDYKIDFDKSLLQKIRIAIKDYYVVQNKGVLKDKDGNKYKYEYIENHDESIQAPFLTDAIYVYDNKNTNIAYLKTKYIAPKQLKFFPEIPPQNNLPVFHNAALPEYARVKEQFQQKGIGKAMYWEMAKNLANKNVDFRSSVLISDKAKIMWDSLKKQHGYSLKTEYINGEKVYCFKHNLINTKKRKMKL